MADWNLGITIEGLGNASAGHDDKRWRWTRLYQDTGTGGDDLQVPVLTDFPSTFAAEVDFRGARSSIGGFSVELQSVKPDRLGTTAASRLYRSRYVSIGLLGAAMTAAQSTITIVDSGGTAVTDLVDSGSLGIALERECLILTSHTGSGVYACTRAEFGTVAAAHSVDDGADTAIFESEHWHIPADREVTVYRVQQNKGQLNEDVITRGVIRGVSSPSPDRIRLDCAGPLELMQLRQLCGKLWRGVTGPISGEVLKVTSTGDSFAAGAYTNPVHRNDEDGSDQNRMLLAIDGKHAVKQRWETVTARFVPFIRVHATFALGGQLSAPFAGSPLLLDLTRLQNVKCHEFFSLHPDAPDLDAAGTRLGKADVNGTTLESNLFVALLQCLLTTPDGGNHATYDLGDTTNPRLFDNLGFGIKSSLVDVAGIQNVALEVGDLGRMPLLHFGLDGEGFDGLEFFQQALKVVGCVLTSGDQGKLSVVRFRDVARLDAPSIPQADVVGIPVQNKRVADTFDSLAVEYAEIPGVGTVTDTFEDVINHRRLLSGRHRASSLDARGVEDRDLFTGPIIARHIQRYHYPIPEITFECLRSQDHWPGTIVKLTHDKVWGASSRGVTDATLLIVGRNESISSGTIRYRALDVGVAYGRVGLIAPSARVSAWDGGTMTVSIADSTVYTSIVGPSDEITSDSGSTTWPVGAEVQFLKPDLSVRDAGPFTVVTTTDGSLTIDGTPTGLTANDVMVPADYDDADATQLAKWIWLADSNNAIGTGNATAFEWTL